jgi:Holliday junction resolvasome RuvABC DNA-binding subunit
LKPKTVENIKILYKKKRTSTNVENVYTTKNEEIDPKILDTCCKALLAYGFSKQEAQELVKKTYADCKSLDCSTLIKLSLTNFGEKNV